jgi:hypothetical protein
VLSLLILEVAGPRLKTILSDGRSGIHCGFWFSTDGATGAPQIQILFLTLNAPSFPDRRRPRRRQPIEPRQRRNGPPNCNAVPQHKDMMS